MESFIRIHLDDQENPPGNMHLRPLKSQFHTSLLLENIPMELVGKWLYPLPRTVSPMLLNQACPTQRWGIRIQDLVGPKACLVVLSSLEPVLSIKCYRLLFKMGSTWTTCVPFMTNNWVWPITKKKKKNLMQRAIRGSGRPTDALIALIEYDTPIALIESFIWLPKIRPSFHISCNNLFIFIIYLIF